MRVGSFVRASSRIGWRVLVMAISLAMILPPPSVLAASSNAAKSVTLPTPVCQSPSGAIETTRPSFVWTPVAGATRYEFELTDASGARVFRRDGIKASPFTLPDEVTLNSGSAYRFAVRAWDHPNQRSSAWSAPLEFSMTGSANQAPIARASAAPSTGVAPLLVTFDGSASEDPDGAISSWSWSFSDDTTATGAVVTHTFPAPGSYTATLTVSDEAGVPASQSVSITVLAAPPLITASVSPIMVVAGNSALLTWDATDATTVIVDGIGAFAPSGSVPVMPATDSTYTLTAYGPGGTASTTVALGVDEAPVPRFSVTPPRGPAPLSVTFDGLASSDPDGRVASWEWDFDSDGVTDATGSTASRTYPSRGEYAVSLTVTDDEGVSRSANQTVSVTSPLPAASISIEPSVVVAGSLARLTWTTSDADRVTISGLGEVRSSGEMSVQVHADASYELLAVNESGEASASASVRADAIPVARASADRTFGTLPLTVAFDGSTSSDPDGDELAYEWDFDSDGVVDATGVTASHSYASAGSHTAALIVTDPYGASSTATVAVHVAAPAPTVSLSVSSQRIRAGEPVTLSWTSTDADSIVISPGIGPVEASGDRQVMPADDTTYTITASGSGGTATATVHVVVVSVAAPAPGTFGSRYEEYVPSDATLASYDATRFALLSGRVFDAAGEPLSGVRVSAKDNAEYGSAVSDASGRYVLPVNGGGTEVLSFEIAGYLPLQRTTDTEWNEIVTLDDVRMTRAEEISTRIELGSTVLAVQSHTGAVNADERGSRALTLVFPAGERAYSIDASGHAVELSELNVRTTEFTSATALPGTLPQTSAFTYCVDISADEAEHVVFDKPVVAWLDDFLGVGPGVLLPAGSYDDKTGVWKAERNGISVRLLDADADGVVDGADGNGDGVADDLNENGSTGDEVSGIETGRFAPGTVVWRVEVSHFSPHDWNFAWALAHDAVPYGPLRCWLGRMAGLPNPCASTVDAQSGVVGEDLPIAGTPLTLHYSSDRARGTGAFAALAMRQPVYVPIDARNAPADAREVVVRLEVAGRTIEHHVLAGRESTITLDWDATDAFGNSVTGDFDAELTAAWVYPVHYVTTRVPAAGTLRMGAFEPLWAATSPLTVGGAGALTTSDRVALNVFSELSTSKKLKLDVAPEGDRIANGWTLSAVPGIDPRSGRTLHRGDGSTEQKAGRYAEIVSVPGGSYDIDFATDGTLWTSDGGQLIATDMDSGVQRVFQTRPGAQVSHVTADRTGGVYYLDKLPSEVMPRVNHMRPDGTWSHVAGTGVYAAARFDIPAIDSPLSPYTMDVGVDGTLYVRDQFGRLVSLGADGRLRLVAGAGGSQPSSVPMLAKDAWIGGGDIACAPDGSIYVASGWYIHKVTTDGMIRHVYGRPRTSGYYPPGLDWSGQSAVDAIMGIAALEVDPAGHLLILDHNSYWTSDIVWEVDEQGLMRNVAGTRETADGKDHKTALPGPATESSLWNVRQIFTDPAGNLWIMRGSSAAEKVTSDRPLHASEGSLGFVEQSGAEHVFASDGRWISTSDGSTGTRLLSASRDASGALTGLTDRFGAEVRIERDARGRVLALVSPDGDRTVLDVDSGNRLRGLELPGGATWRIDYHNNGLLGDVTSPKGGTAHHTYDNTGRALSATDEDGRTFDFYGAEGADGSFTSSMRTSEGTFKTMISSSDAGGSTMRIVTTRGSTSTLFHSQDGLTTTEQTPGGTTTTKRIWDNFLGVLRPASSTVTMPSGLKSQLTLDRSWTLAGAQKRPVSRTDRATLNGRVTSSTTDFVAGTVTVASPAGRIVRSTYDTATLLPKSASVSGLAALSYEYDSRGRITALHAGERTTSYSYDTSGNLAALTGPDGRQTAFEYDSAGRKTAQVRPDGTRIAYSYDSAGSMTSLVVPGGGLHEFGSSLRGLPTTWTLPGAGSYSYRYDGAKRLKSVTTPGGSTISNSFDANGLQVRTDFDGGSISTIRGKCGRVFGLARGSEVASLSYDGSLVTRKTVRGSVVDTMSWSYNSDFAPTSFAYAGATQRYGYDSDGLLTSAAPFTISRNAANGLPQSVTATGFALNRTYSAYGEIDAVNAGAYRYSLTRDASGRIATKTETVDGTTHEWAYAYDQLGRLTSATRDGELAESYTFDAQGNRTAYRAPLRGISETVTPAFDAADRVLSSGEATYAYSSEGELSSKATSAGVTTYAYTGLSELESVTLPGGRVVSYRYDANGSRVAKLVDGTVTERYEWADPTRLLATYDGAGALTRRFLYADARVPYAMETSAGTYLLAFDQVGSLRAVTDGSSALVKATEHDSFGNLIADSNPELSVPLGFAGGLSDPDTGLVHFGAREYDSATGRWISRDPIGLSGGDVNLYGYCLGDPVGLVDPAGLLPNLRGTPSLETPEGMQVMADLAAQEGAAGAESAAGQAARSAASQASNRLGQAGEAAVQDATGLAKNTNSVRTCTGDRIPDFVDKANRLIIEVKNSKYVSNTKQIRGIIDYAVKHEQEFVLLVRDETTRLSGPLLKAISDAGGSIGLIP